MATKIRILIRSLDVNVLDNSVRKIVNTIENENVPLELQTVKNTVTKDKQTLMGRALLIDEDDFTDGLIKKLASLDLTHEIKIKITNVSN